MLKVRSDIIKLREEIDFNEQYLPYFDRIKIGYTKRSDSLKNREKAAQSDLTRYRSERDSLKMFFDGKKVSLHFFPMGANPQSYLDKLENIYIPNKEKELKNIQSTEITDADLLADRDFREWLKARVNVDFAASELVKSQEKYVQDLKAFKAMARDNTKGFDFSLDALPYELPLVNIIEQKLTVSRVNL